MYKIFVKFLVLGFDFLDWYCYGVNCVEICVGGDVELDFFFWLNFYEIWKGINDVGYDFFFCFFIYSVFVGD